MRLAVLSTHPIQYYAPYFRRLTERGRIDLKVFFGWRGALEDSYDPGFGQNVTWDIPLLEGYAHAFVENASSDPGTHHFRGIDNPGMIDEIEAYDPDALLVFGWNYRTHLRVLRYFHGRIPIFFRGDSTLLDEQGGPRTWVRRLVLTWVYRHVDTALYVGQNNRAYYEAHGLDDDQLAWVPHAIDNDRFADPDGRHADKAATWRDELGIAPEAPVVLFAGKLGPKKAPGLLLDAFLRLDVPGAHLVYAGSGPLDDQLQARAGEGVHFLGFQNQSVMPAVYRLGDVVVLPSRGPGETWGLAINEAMACQRAVVASTKVGCAPDLIVDGKNGFTFAADDASALTDALTKILAPSGRSRSMGKQSADLISDWSIEEAAIRTERTICSTSSFEDVEL